MNKKNLLYIYILFFLCFCKGIIGQNLSLKLIGKDSIETSIVNQISFQNSHAKKEDLSNEIHAIHEKIKRIGFFTAIIEEITNKKREFTVKFNLGKKTKEIVVILSGIPKLKYTTFLTKKDSIRLVTKELESFITNITSELDEKGASFSKITLEDPIFIKGILYLKLKIQKSNERKINKVILKNYEEFPLSFIKNYFKINPATTF